jgi:hypothetical protein
MQPHACKRIKQQQRVVVVLIEGRQNSIDRHIKAHTHDLYAQLRIFLWTQWRHMKLPEAPAGFDYVPGRDLPSYTGSCARQHCMLSLLL